MRTLPLVLLAIAALVAPAVAIAGGSSSPAAQSFVITGMVLGDQEADASGKVSIEGSQLIASVGCNTISGAVDLDGDTLTVSGPLAMTEMGCPTAIGGAEGMLIKVLQHGPFRIGAGAWSGDGATLLVEELAAGVPGPNASTPDDPVSSSPGEVTIDPSASCPPLPSGLNGTTPVDGGPGSAGGSSGSTGSGTAGSGSAPAATAVDLPAARSDQPPAPPDPGATPEPGATLDLGQKEPEPSVAEDPAPSGMPAPDATAGTVDPDPGFGGIGTDPGFGKPVIIDPCDVRVYVVVQANGAGAMPPKAVDASAEHAPVTTDAATLVLPLGAAAIVVLAGMALVFGPRWRSPTPR